MEATKKPVFFSSSYGDQFLWVSQALGRRLAERGFELRTLTTANSGARELQSELNEQLRTCFFFIADLTPQKAKDAEGVNRNVMHEVGLASALSIPMVLIHDARWSSEGLLPSNIAPRMVKSYLASLDGMDRLFDDTIAPFIRNEIDAHPRATQIGCIAKLDALRSRVLTLKRGDYTVFGPLFELILRRLNQSIDKSKEFQDKKSTQIEPWTRREMIDLLFAGMMDHAVKGSTYQTVSTVEFLATLPAHSPFWDATLRAMKPERDVKVERLLLIDGSRAHEMRKLIDEIVSFHTAKEGPRYQFARLVLETTEEYNSTRSRAHCGIFNIYFEGHDQRVVLFPDYDPATPGYRGTGYDLKLIRYSKDVDTHAASFDDLWKRATKSVRRSGGAASGEGREEGGGA